MATLPFENEFEPVWLKRITRFEYERLYGDPEIPGEKVELLDGLVFKVSPILPPHASAVSRLIRALAPLLDRVEIRPGQPVVVSDWSEPEPDVALVALGDYRAEHPATALLVVEVSYTSLRYDRGIKRRVYAEAGIPEYWIVNLVDRVVEVYTEPKDGAYAASRTVRGEETLAPRAFPDFVIAVASLLP